MLLQSPTWRFQSQSGWRYRKDPSRVRHRECPTSESGRREGTTTPCDQRVEMSRPQNPHRGGVQRRSESPPRDTTEVGSSSRDAPETPRASVGNVRSTLYDTGVSDTGDARTWCAYDGSECPNTVDLVVVLGVDPDELGVSTPPVPHDTTSRISSLNSVGTPPSGPVVRERREFWECKTQTLPPRRNF